MLAGIWFDIVSQICIHITGHNTYICVLPKQCKPHQIMLCIMFPIFCLHHYKHSGVSQTHTSLQKQGGCFNHRVVTMVTDKLERHCMVMRGLLLALETNYIRQPKEQLPGSSYNHNTLKAFITSVIPSPGYIKSMKVPHCNFNLKCICNDSFTDVLRVFLCIVVVR